MAWKTLRVSHSSHSTTATGSIKRKTHKAEVRRPAWRSQVEASTILTEGVHAYTRRLEIARELVGLDPQNAEWKLDLALSNNVLGVALERTGLLEEAQAHFEKDLEIKKKLLATDPENTRWSQRLGAAHYFLGENLRRRGLLGEAESQFRAQLEVARRLARQDPRNLKWKRDLGVAKRSLAEILAWEGKLPTAERLVREAASDFQFMTDQEPDHWEWRYQAGKTLNLLGFVLLRSGAHESALREASRAVHLFEQLDPSELQQQGEASLLLASTQEALGQVTEAEKTRIRCLAGLNADAEDAELWQQAQQARALMHLERSSDAGRLLDRLKQAGFWHPELDALL